MKRLLILSTLLLVSIHTILAQNYITQVKTSTGKWGYATIKNELVIPAIYSKCYPFTEILAVVFDPNKEQFYFLTGKGEPITPEIAKFDIQEGFFGAGSVLFGNGLIPFRVNKKWGYLNTSGKIAIPAKYDDVSLFDGGYTSAKVGDKFYILDVNGSETPFTSGTDLKHFSEGFAPFKSSDGKIGYSDTKGNVVIKPAFKSVGYFIGGLAWVKNMDGKMGYIDKTGAWVIQPTYDDAKDFDPESGFARIKAADKWAYIDKTGKMLNVVTDTYGDFSNGLAMGKQNDKFGFFNTSGTWVIQPQFEGLRDFKNGYAAAKLNSKWGVIDKQGKWIINPTYDGIKDMELVK